MNMKTLPIALLGLGCLASSQGLAAPNPDVVLQARVVHTVTGQDISPGEVRFSDGLITAIGTTVDHSGAQVVALTNQHLYPGLIALDTGLGLAEISGVRATLDLTEVGDYTPEVESWLAANPDSELIPVARANGIVCFEPVPQGGDCLRPFRSDLCGRLDHGAEGHQKGDGPAYFLAIHGLVAALIPARGSIPASAPFPGGSGPGAADKDPGIG